MIRTKIILKNMTYNKASNKKKTWHNKAKARTHNKTKISNFFKKNYRKITTPKLFS